MKPGEVWWSQIGTSLRFIDSVSNHLRDCQSAVLQVPQRFPWRQDFYAAVDLRRTAYSGERRLVRLPWTEGVEPGEFVLDELCSSKIKADYWPGQSYASYLGGKEDILICDYYIWITGIHTKNDIEKWCGFVSEYTEASRHLSRAALFLIEYDGNSLSDKLGISVLPYEVADYDCRVFALEVSSSLNNTELQNYQAELALSISGKDPEFCYALLCVGEKLVKDPVKTALLTNQSVIPSSGVSFSRIGENQVTSLIWEATLIQLFPILERFRMKFIEKNEETLLAVLPITNSNGEIIKDPKDLEIGTLSALIAKAKTFSIEEAEKVRLCRRVRNLLAHNKTVPYNEVFAVYKI